jgi:hypothetical protein
MVALFLGRCSLGAFAFESRFITKIASHRPRQLRLKKIVKFAGISTVSCLPRQGEHRRASEDSHSPIQCHCHCRRLSDPALSQLFEFLGHDHPKLHMPAVRREANRRIEQHGNHEKHPIDKVNNHLHMRPAR